MKGLNCYFVLQIYVCNSLWKYFLCHFADHILLHLYTLNTSKPPKYTISSSSPKKRKKNEKEQAHLQILGYRGFLLVGQSILFLPVLPADTGVYKYTVVQSAPSIHVLFASLTLYQIYLHNLILIFAVISYLNI